MKNLTSKGLMLFLLILSSYQAIGQTCAVSIGNNYLYQSDIDNFSTDYPGCTEVTNHLRIHGTVTDLTGLSQLTRISDRISISSSTGLTNLDGLENIEYINNFNFTNTPNLVDVSAIYDVDSLNIFNLTNSGIKEFTGFQNLHSMQSIRFWDNDSLKSITGFSNIDTVVDNVSLIRNPELANVQGFSNIKVVGGLSIEESALADLSYFSSLQKIGVISLSQMDWVSVTGLSPSIEVSSLYLLFMPLLANVDVFYPTDSAEFIFLYNLPELKNLNGFSNLVKCESLSLNYLQMITNLDELSNLTYCNSISVSNLDKIDNIDGLSKCQYSTQIYIEENDSLSDITGLYNIDASQLQQVRIYGNPLLDDCSIKSLCQFANDPSAFLNIYENGLNCNEPMEILDNCCKDTLIIDWPFVVGGLYEASKDIILKSDIPADSTINLSYGPAGKAIIADSVKLNTSSTLNILQGGCND